MSAVERVQELVQPLVEHEGAELYDIEHEAGVLRIMVDRPGGIDVDTIGKLSQDISEALDVDDPIADAKYLLEVTSPGIERKLRTPAHFKVQIGEDVIIKVNRGVEGNRRCDGVVTAADDERVEITETVKDKSSTISVTRSLAYSDIESARLVFHWEDLAKPKSSKKLDKETHNHNSITNKKASAR